MTKLKFPKTHTPIVDMDLWDMFLTALEDNEENIKDRLTELGYEVMSALLSTEEDDE